MYLFYALTLVDTIGPNVTSCPTGIIEKVHKGTLNSRVYWEPPSATDLSKNITVSRNRSPGDIFEVGQSLVLYIFRDPAGNMGVCSFYVHVIEGNFFYLWL